MSKSRKNLIWESGWYELDQPVKVGTTQKFMLLKGEDKFFNSLLNSGEHEEIEATVVSISHPVLGNFIELDTEGLTYTFTLEDGKKIKVEAEETPGVIENPEKIFEGKVVPIDDWRFTVIVDLIK